MLPVEAAAAVAAAARSCQSTRCSSHWRQACVWQCTLPLCHRETYPSTQRWRQPHFCLGSGESTYCTVPMIEVSDTDSVHRTLVHVHIKAEVGVKYWIRIWIYETKGFQNFRMKKRSAPNPRNFPKDIHSIYQKWSFLLFFPWPRSGQFRKISRITTIAF